MTSVTMPQEGRNGNVTLRREEGNDGSPVYERRIARPHQGNEMRYTGYRFTRTGHVERRDVIVPGQRQPYTVLKPGEFEEVGYWPHTIKKSTNATNSSGG